MKAKKAGNLKAVESTGPKAKVRIPKEMRKYKQAEKKFMAEMGKIKKIENSPAIMEFMKMEEEIKAAKRPPKYILDLRDVSEAIGDVRKKFSFVKAALEQPGIYELMGDNERYGLYLLTNDIENGMKTAEKSVDKIWANGVPARNKKAA